MIRWRTDSRTSKTKTVSALLALFGVGMFAAFSARAEAERDPASTFEAQSTFDLSFIPKIGHDLMAPLTSPGSTYLLFGAGSALAAYPFRKSVATEVGGDKPLGKSAPYGYELGLWKINVAYFLTSLGYGIVASSPKAIDDSMLMLRASVYTALVTTGLKEMQFEQRPRRDGDRASFPSGHASNAFAFAGTIYRNHGPWAGIPALAIASFVSFSRLNDNAHYLHDTLFGAGLGLSYSFGLDSVWSDKATGRSVALVPIVSGKDYGAATVIDF
ncbi:MAG: phosphatase PAP2 family protein [Bdellovibrionales bacterium]|nr:phosphatase PAP2 family protein [Bdellovibrionales bacterium]